VRRPAYDCWGEAVNLTSRLESIAIPGTIVISESAFWRLRPLFEIDALGEPDLKGIGMTKVFQLNGQRAVPLLGLDMQAADPV
jgi:adenylate cyclase